MVGLPWNGPPIPVGSPCQPQLPSIKWMGKPDLTGLKRWHTQWRGQDGKRGRALDFQVIFRTAFGLGLALGQGKANQKQWPSGRNESLTSHSVFSGGTKANPLGPRTARGWHP